MSNNNRIKVFLLLGVMLVRIIISGCTPEQPTEPSMTEPGQDTIAFHEFVNAQNINVISIWAVYWSYSIRINDENRIHSFIESFLKEAQFTDNAEIVSFDTATVFNTMYRLNITFMLQDGTQFSMYVSPEGFASISWNGLTYYLLSPEKLDYQAIRSY